MSSSRSHRWKAISFDMDGVVLDSMPLHYRLWSKILADYGVKLARKDVFLREGEKAEKSIYEIFKLHGRILRAGHLEEMFRKKKALMKEEGAAIRVFPGMLPLLRSLKKKGFPLALVTGTRRQFMRRILPRRARRYFNAVVTSDDVRHGKPHPESYRLAARKLGVPAKRTLVIENAPFGIRAARRSGGYCVALATTLAPRYLAEADCVVRSHRELNIWIKHHLPALPRTGL